MYKIKLACTGKKEFSYKNQIINNKNIDDIVNNLNLRTYQYVEKGHFTYKTNVSKMFTCKFMEITCNDKITKNAFKNFIKKLKKIGFYSDDDSRVELIDTTTNNIVYGYHFQTMSELKDKKYDKKHKNTSRYAITKFFHNPTYVI